MQTTAFGIGLVLVGAFLPVLLTSAADHLLADQPPPRGDPLALARSDNQANLFATSGGHTPRTERRPKASKRRERRQEEHLRRFKRRNKSSTGTLPEFAVPIGNVTAVVGRDVRLVCTVENLGQYQVAWLKEESRTILSIDTNIIITNYRIFLIPDEEERKWVLHIKDVQESDRGFYQCQVNTSPMRSTSGYLEVVVPPNFVEPQTTQMAEVVERSNVSLQCKAGGYPKPTITWRRDDGQPIQLAGRSSSPSPSPPPLASLSSRLAVQLADNNQTASSQLSYVTSDRLPLTDVDRSTAGLYVCTASNGIPSQVSKRIPLYVKFAPKVSIQSKYISVSLGDQLEIDCLIEAFPKANSYWSKKQLSQSGALRAGGSVAVGGELAPARWQSLLAPRPADRRALSYRRNKSIYEQVNEMSSAARPIAPPEAGSMVGPAGRGFDPGGSMGPLELQDTGLGQKESDRHLSVGGGPEPARRQVHDEHEGDELDQGAEEELSSRNPTGSEGPAGEEEATSGSRGALVSVKQTLAGPYSHRLRLTIGRMHHEDYGQYSCISSNSMGSAEGHVIVTKADRISERNRQIEAMNGLEEGDYQRDSLAETALGSGGSGQRSTGSDMRRNSSPNLASRIYDENYLQAIKSRQANGLATSKLQQKLRMRPDRSSAAGVVRPLMRPRGLAVATVAVAAASWLLLLAVPFWPSPGGVRPTPGRVRVERKGRNEPK